MSVVDVVVVTVDELVEGRLGVSVGVNTVEGVSVSQTV